MFGMWRCVRRIAFSEPEAAAFLRNRDKISGSAALSSIIIPEKASVSSPVWSLSNNNVRDDGNIRHVFRLLFLLLFPSGALKGLQVSGVYSDHH